MVETALSMVEQSYVRTLNTLSDKEAYTDSPDESIFFITSIEPPMFCSCSDFFTYVSENMSFPMCPHLLSRLLTSALPQKSNNNNSNLTNYELANFLLKNL